MKKKLLFKIFKELDSKIIILLVIFFSFSQFLHAQTSLRRPVSPNQPMWLVHIDTWNYADPQKIIDLIPADIRPYVVMNISLSVSHDVATSQFKVAEYGYEIAKSWIRTCAENRMWAMIQPSSGGYSHFSDTDLSVYEEFYKNYPNFIGFNYAEQFWGFDDASDALSPTWPSRMTHFANLLKLSNKYGGYLSVSWCGNQWSPAINPIAMMKRNSAFAAACRDYTENYILSEKYTQVSYQSDMESICLGAYLSGYSGNYGIRYDDTGWTDVNGNHEGFIMATGLAPHFEHMMLTGQTVIDGPELIWTQDFRETNRISTTDGYMTRNWERFPQFDNTSIDIFRKVLDGTARIPSRQEVIDRTKVVIVNDVQSGTSDDIYSSPATMFEGLYRMDTDGNLKDNKSFFKKTGRYPTIPTVFQLDDVLAQSFSVKVNKSDYATKWPSIGSKQTDFNTIFPQEYTGDIYAGRHENAWVTYNPFKTGQTATGSIPFKYNTCDKVELNYSQYTTGIIKEYADKVTFYLANFDEKNTGLKTNIVKIYGSSSEPTYSFTDRGNHSPSVITKDWSSGVLTLTIQQNGPLDLTVNCAGTATGRLTSYTTASLIEPTKPSLYVGPRQNEAEFFEYKNINSITTAGNTGSIRFYQGQGYLDFGTNAGANIRDVISALRKGTYQLDIRYTAPTTGISTIDLYVNGVKVATPVFAKTSDISTWGVVSQNVQLNEGNNEIKLVANSTGAATIYFDNIKFSENQNNGVYNFTNDVATTSASNPPANLISIKSGSAGVVSTTDSNSNTSNTFKTYSVGSTNGTGVADLDLFQNNAKDYSVTWKEIYNTAGAKKGVLLRATGANGSCTYAEGMKQGYLFIVLNNSDGTVTLKPYIAGPSGITPKTTYTTTNLKINPGQPAWYRATALGNKLIFECSADGISWEGGNVATFQDGTYTSGSSELVWGLSSNIFNWVIDDITFGSVDLSINKFSLGSYGYEHGKGPSTSQTFSVSGVSLLENVVLTAPSDFEISLSNNGSYSSTLTLTPSNGTIASTPIYVRMKAGLSVGDKTGTIIVKSNALEQQVALVGKVYPVPVFVKYDFTNDVATTAATTPPASYVSIGQNNTTTAGVVSYTDAGNYTSNVLKTYSGSQRNNTAVLNLDAFSNTATDYSITWKQYVSNVTKEYKIGMLLRGDAGTVGTNSTGYSQGIMGGYLFLAYNTLTDTQFRIYRSTSSTSLAVLSNVTKSLKVSANSPIWYRASVSGSGEVSLKIEYSTDGVNWIVGTTATETGSIYNMGGTQLVHGLGIDSSGFVIDDISFSGLNNPGTTILDDDNDGIANNIDTCPNTAIGEIVNIYGCIYDDDQDGVSNKLDTCPNTPSGQTVNSSGCASSQLDDDGDGVSNSVDLCPNTLSGQSVDANGCLIIGANNFAIEVSGETCPDKNNGQVKITATQNLTYSATVNGVNKVFSDKTLLLNDLAPNTYDICINIAEGNIKQCYSIVVPESAAITAKTTATSERLEVAIQSGTAPYQVNVNGVLQFETNNTNFTVNVNSGDVLEVTSSKPCEGTFAKTITLYDLVKVTPNPTSGPFDIYLPTNDTTAVIEIYTVGGVLISKGVYTIENGKVHLDLEKQSTGIYIIKVQSTPVQIVKIIKK